LASSTKSESQLELLPHRRNLQEIYLVFTQNSPCIAAMLKAQGFGDCAARLSPQSY
jgi:hypothetical protein